MEELIRFIFAHDRAAWASGATRAAYESLHMGGVGGGHLTDTEWRSALGTVYARQRVVDAFGFAGPEATVGQVLYGVLSFGANVAIRVLVTYTDVAGYQHRAPLDIAATRGMTVQDVLDAAREQGLTEGLAAAQEVTDVRIIQGSYRL